MNTGPGSPGAHSSSGESCRQIYKDHTVGVKVYKQPFVHHYIRLHSAVLPASSQQAAGAAEAASGNFTQHQAKPQCSPCAARGQERNKFAHCCVTTNTILLLEEKKTKRILAASRFSVQIQTLLTACLGDGALLNSYDKKI